MQGPWIASSTGLPHNGEAIEFQLDNRQIALDGTYDHETFRSRWAGYEVGRVTTWRSSGMDKPAVELPI